MALDFNVIALDDADSRLVDYIAFPRRYELARRNGIQRIQETGQGLPRFQQRVVRRIDLLDVAIAFDVEDGVYFFDLDTAADEAEDHLAAVALADAFHDAVHGLVELFLRKGLDQVMGSPDGKGFDGKFFARRQEDDFRPALLLAHLCGNIRPSRPGIQISSRTMSKFPSFSKASTKSMALL